MNSPRVYIIVLNWNGSEDTLACMKSLETLIYPCFNVIVVDNGSTDDSLLHLRSYEAPYSVTILETGRNLGYAGGNNVGIRWALNHDADYVLLLNNDTVVDSRLLDAFVAAAQRYPNAGVFSGKIYYHAEPKRIWYAGAKWNGKTARFDQIGMGELDDDRLYSTSCETAYASGCAFFIPTMRVREIGLLDEDFFLYFEETDWSFRAKSAGHPSIFVPEAKLWHKVSVSFGGEGSPLALYFITRNRMLWASRHASMPRRLQVYGTTIWLLIQRFSKPLMALRFGKVFSLKTIWWGIREAFNNPSNLACYFGVRDFCLRRFGNCPDVIRDLAKGWSAKQSTRA